jgi:hypothetical protein
MLAGNWVLAAMNTASRGIDPRETFTSLDISSR